jgi:hypothetical protein
VLRRYSPGDAELPASLTAHRGSAPASGKPARSGTGAAAGASASPASSDWSVRARPRAAPGPPAQTDHDVAARDAWLVALARTRDRARRPVHTRSASTHSAARSRSARAARRAGRTGAVIYDVIRPRHRIAPAPRAAARGPGRVSPSRTQLVRRTNGHRDGERAHRALPRGDVAPRGDPRPWCSTARHGCARGSSGPAHPGRPAGVPPHLRTVLFLGKLGHRAGSRPQPRRSTRSPTRRWCWWASVTGRATSRRAGRVALRGRTSRSRRCRPTRWPRWAASADVSLIPVAALSLNHRFSTPTSCGRASPAARPWSCHATSR